MTDKYVLDQNGNPRPEPDLYKWGRWMQNADDRVVKLEEVGTYSISTVFLGLDHSFGGPTPVLWETMVFGEGEMSGEMNRCAGSREQAEAMHHQMVERVKGKL